MSDDRDYLEEALALVDGTSPRLAERAHLVALHEYWQQLRADAVEDSLCALPLYAARIVTLLRKLDAEHSHSDECPTCEWIEAQPEWEDIVNEWREERSAHGFVD